MRERERERDFRCLRRLLCLLTKDSIASGSGGGSGSGGIGSSLLLNFAKVARPALSGALALAPGYPADMTAAASDDGCVGRAKTAISLAKTQTSATRFKISDNSI